MQKKSRLGRWLRRLYDMKPYEIAWVPFGANHRAFAVVKEDSQMAPQPKPLTLNDVVKAHGILGELIPIFKAEGGMDATAAEAVAQKLDAVADLILPVGDDPATAGISATVTLKDSTASLVKMLETLASQAIATDYTFGDQVDAVVELAKQIAKQSAEMPQLSEEVKAEEVKPEEPKPEETRAEEPKPAEPVAAAPAAEPVSAAPAEVAAAPQADSASAPVTQEPVIASPQMPATIDASIPLAEPTIPTQVVAQAPNTPIEMAPGVQTQSQTIGGVSPAQVQEIVATAMKQQFADLQKQLMVEVQKSLTSSMLPPPATTPAATVLQPPPPETTDDPMDNFDLASSPDLNKIDEYGRWIK